MSHQSDLIASDIQEYLHQHENKELLRFLTCGSVDDGKSTLIGRLLHDSKMIYEDQLAAIQKDNERVGNAGEELDLALLVDGLAAEREQGITIDVAYRYFSTSKRKFIIADTPGHEQYTRNMATGASTCDLAIILIDARHGVQVQTKRHSFIVSQLGIKHTIVAINKMDLVDFSEERFEEIKADYIEFSKQLDLPDIQFVPISALKGDNVVSLSESMGWYQGEPLMETLETVEIANDQNFDELRFPVQYVNRPNLDFRGYCGTLTSGVVRPGDEVTVLPSGKSSKVKSIVTFEGEIDEAFPPMAVTLTLEDEIDISRGDMLVHSNAVPDTTNRFDAMVVWMAEESLQPGRQYEVKLNTTRVAGGISHVRHRVDVNTLEQSAASTLELNEIARCEITLERAVVADDYRSHHGTGSFIIVDRLTNATVAAGMIIDDGSQNEIDLDGSLISTSDVDASARAVRLGQSAAAIVISGSDAEIRETLLFSLEKVLFERGRAVVAFDQSQLGDLKAQVAGVAALFNQAGLISLIESDASVEGAINLNTDSLAGDSAKAKLQAAVTQLQAKEII
ncbi:sulfate adenylyltransferase subunit CysN [Neptuniibacter caesariensis]|uniref:Sulfate adenylyltransferase subunit 1 n=1 Tax=Neptuniibacter caesariensis TaxID=207954 RepID=A0A7U8C963_NEPCE|nr:sulfate adenylyltransferase subunit CysN [Neptuniibacter caesariensis]EAR62439.1 binfunctional sulfate adenylyltransferase subunit 1/adenylylsulfate kinase protein [Oceanospirillum sp. MED92] [Neptuniibacter caesariensis]